MKSAAIFPLIAFVYLSFRCDGRLTLILSTSKDNIGSVAGPAFLMAIKEMRQSKIADSIRWKAISVDGSDRSLLANYFQALDDAKPHLIVSFAQYNLAVLAAISETSYISVTRGADLFAALPGMFPTFITSRFGTEYFGKIVTRLMEHYKLTRVAIIYSHSDIQRYRSEELKKYLQKTLSPSKVYSFVFPVRVQESIGYDTFEPTVKFMLSFLKPRTICKFGFKRLNSPSFYTAYPP